MPERGDNRKDENKSPEGPRKQPGGPGLPPRPGRNYFGWVIIVAMVLLMVLVFQAIAPKPESLKFAEFRSLYTEGHIEDVLVEDNAVIAMRTDTSPPQKVQVTKRPGESQTFWLDKVDALTNGNFEQSQGPSLWVQILFNPLLWMIIFFLVIWFIILRGLRGAGGAGGMLGNFGKSRHKVMARDSTGVTFKDVAGVEEAKDELTEIVEFLKHPKKFMRLGGRIPRGVLLMGPPGCGKTLLAKAIAGEADVPFFSISGSDFVEMFVGVGASRVRDLFKQAKESSPCIIFLDEIDAVGRKRGSGFTSGGHDEREQTLNAILVEMDGFESSDQVIVIAATNRADVLDPALTRPGRFDRQVAVSLPDIKGRYEILTVHGRKVKLGPNVDLMKIARGTPMFSGAELAAIMNEAAVAATMLEKDFIEQEDLEEARDKVKWGRSRKSRVIEEAERIATAYHEAGHAVLQCLIPDGDPLHKVTIIPRGQSLGATFSFPEKDRYGYSLKWIKATMRVVCGGRIAEERKTSDVSSGAAQDIQQLTTLARAMVLEWGMSERLGFVRYSGDEQSDPFPHDRDYSEQTAAVIDEEIQSFARDAYDDAQKLLDDNWDKVVAVAEALLKYETLTSAEVHTLMRGESLDKPSVSDLLTAEADKRRDAAPKPSSASDEEDDLNPGVVPSPA
ncbi:MAG: ATP-dependent zinc metalloprotease FtsH [Phycisphaerales bacterium]